MWLDRVSNPGPLALESDALPTAPRCRAIHVPNNISVLQIRRGEKDNLGIILHITPLKLMLGPNKGVCPTGHSERKKKKGQTEEEVGRQYQRVDRNGLCRLS